nr:hypothetical protein Iba_contig3467CG0010 [Ipomoea batatas]
MVGYDKHLQWRTQGVEVPRRRAATELTGDTTVATTSSMVRLANNYFDQGLLFGDEMEEPWKRGHVAVGLRVFRGSGCGSVEEAVIGDMRQDLLKIGAEDVGGGGTL